MPAPGTTRVRRILRPRDMERETALEQKVARLKAKLADLQERRVVAQFATPYVDGPRFHLDYDNGDFSLQVLCS